MLNRTKTIVLAALVALTQSVFSAPAFSADMELVESVPAETVYGSKDTARPGEVWPAMIDAAQKTLDIEEFYFSAGPALTPVLDAIKRASDRGIKLRIIIDSKYYGKKPEIPNELKKLPGVSLVTLNMGSGVQHAKFFIVDGKQTFVGSQNMDSLSLSQIHEMGARMNNAAMAATFLAVFNYDWNKAQQQAAEAAAAPAAPSAEQKPGVAAKALAPSADQPAKPKMALARNATNGGNGNPSGLVNRANPVIIDGAKVYPVFSPPDMLPPGVDSEISVLMRLLKSAKKSVNVQVMNYGLSSYGSTEQWAELNNALKATAVRGVSVSMAVADWTLKKPEEVKNLVELSKVPNMHLKYSKIPQASTGFEQFSRVDHSKYMVIDDKISWVSTANWEKNYFYSARNASIVVESPEVAKKLQGVFDTTWSGPYVSDIKEGMTFDPPEIVKPNEPKPAPAPGS